MSELIQLQNIGNIISNIGNKFIQNKNLMRCIKYDSANALSTLLSDINNTEIAKLIGKGLNPKEDQRIYKTPFNDKTISDVRSELRFFSPYFKPENLYLSEVIISFQITIHNSLWELENNTQRPLIMIQEILNDLNGFDVGGIGELQLDGAIKIVAWNDNFSGYQINMRTRTS
jgi:hypothetical protein